MKPGFNYTGITISFYCHDGKGNFLLHKRSKNCRDEHGRWDCGGGQLKFGEDFEKGVLREIQEEYGCRGEIQEQLPVISIVRKHKGKKTHWVSIPFFVKVDPKKVRNNDPYSIEELGWFRLDKLPKPLHTGFAYTLNKYKSYFQKYKK